MTARAQVHNTAEREAAPADGSPESLLAEDVQVRRTDEHLTGRVWAPVLLLQGLGSILLLLLAAVVTASVVLRAFGAGFVGTVEFGAMAMVLLVALGIPAVTAARENFRLEIIDMVATPRTVRFLDTVALVIQLVVGAVVTAFAVALFVDDLSTGTTMAGELGVHRAWLTGVVGIGFALTVYAVAVRLVRAFRALRGYRDKEI